MWLTSRTSELLLNGLRWRLSRIPKQVQVLSSVWSHRLKSQELEHVAIQLIRASWSNRLLACMAGQLECCLVVEPLELDGR